MSFGLGNWTSLEVRAISLLKAVKTPAACSSKKTIKAEEFRLRSDPKSRVGKVYKETKTAFCESTEIPKTQGLGTWASLMLVIAEILSPDDASKEDDETVPEVAAKKFD
jgi:hypothetical protein